MRYELELTPAGWTVASYLGAVKVHATLYGAYGAALAAWCRLAGR
jgi:hypothetical protein